VVVGFQFIDFICAFGMIVNFAAPSCRWGEVPVVFRDQSADESRLRLPRLAPRAVPRAPGRRSLPSNVVTPTV
jgi:hypothetical protein